MECPIAARTGDPFAVQRLLGHANLKMATRQVQDFPNNKPVRNHIPQYIQQQPQYIKKQISCCVHRNKLTILI